jgi:hypothetical protein
MDVLLFLSSTPSFLWETRVVSFIKLACCFHKFHHNSIIYHLYALYTYQFTLKNHEKFLY